MKQISQFPRITRLDLNADLLRKFPVGESARSVANRVYNFCWNSKSHFPPVVLPRAERGYLLLWFIFLFVVQVSDSTWGQN